MVGALAVVKPLPEVRVTELPQEDIKWCTVSLSDVLDTGKRLEASVFEVEGRHAREAVENCTWGTVPLGEPGNGLLEKAYYPGRFKRIYCSAECGVPFYLPSQMTDIRPKPDKYISALTKCDISDLKLKRGDLLLTRSGTIGNSTIVSQTLEDVVFSDDVIRVTPKNPIDLGYLYAFFRSETGYKILQTNQYGSVIRHIEPEHLYSICVPNPPEAIKKKINDLIMQSYRLRDESNELLDTATKMLVETLNLPPIKEFQIEQFGDGYETNNYSVKLSETNKRLDGSYHVPIAKAITEHLRRNAKELLTVGDKRVSKDIILPGRFKRVYVEEGQGRVFFGGKQLFELDPSNKKYLSLAHHGDRIKEQLELHENMTLITCSGTIGKVTLVPRQWERWAANQHIIRVVPASDEIAGYLSVFLSSEYGYPLITRFTYGSVVDEINATHVSQIPFPILADKPIQDKINQLALKANSLRYEAYKLEQEALRSMNDEVIFA
ncbi:restriction endonuclease subunit S [Christensenella minuta]|uniref:restriction endonuclease subunit S n=1 Tax=Christensenella minuta TaxID=626937 RepID=UPI00321FDCCB